MYVADAADEADVTEHGGKRGQGGDVTEEADSSPAGPPMSTAPGTCAGQTDRLVRPKCPAHIGLSPSLLSTEGQPSSPLGPSPPHFLVPGLSALLCL